MSVSLGPSMPTACTGACGLEPGCTGCSYVNLIDEAWQLRWLIGATAAIAALTWLAFAHPHAFVPILLLPMGAWAVTILLAAAREQVAYLIAGRTRRGRA